MGKQGALKDISKEMLEGLYWGQRLSCENIAQMLSVYHHAIIYQMDKYDIPRRVRSEANKGRSPWNTGLTKKTSPILTKVSKHLKGEHSPNFGKFGKEHPTFGYRHSDEWKGRRAEWSNHIHHTATSKATLRRKQKALWEDPDYKDRTVKILREAQQKRPTKGELKLIQLFQEHNIPYEYVGDGAVIIYGLNPDFINCNGQKKIIEFFGRYWHQDRKDTPYERTEAGRKEIFSRLGYKTLIIWDHELRDEATVIQKIKDFEQREVHHGRR